MSTLELEHLKHTSSSTNNLSVHSDGSLTLGSLQGNVGIGTASPQTTLDTGYTRVYNSGAASSPASGKGLEIHYVTSGRTQGEGAYLIPYDRDNSAYKQFTVDANSINLSTVGSNRMLVDAAGNVVTPYQPGVNVAPLSGESGAYNNASNNNQYCMWSSVRWQVGNSYNTSNGTFTAPITGKYYVSFHSNWYNSGAGTWIMQQVYKNGSVYEQWYHSTGGQGTWMNEQGATIVDCAQNDTIRLYKQTQSGSGGGADVGNYGGFVVRLLG